MNIAEKLKKCPKGMKLYSPIFGELELYCVKDDKEYPITCITRKGSYELFTSEGRYFLDYSDAECMLFPSKDQRDWSKFGVGGKKIKYQFKPFDRVLARDSDDEFWFSEHFGHIENDGSFICGGKKYSQCIPYEGNEHLLGTTNKPE